MNGKDFITKEEARNNFMSIGFSELFGKNESVMDKLNRDIREASLHAKTHYDIPFEYLKDMECKDVELLIDFLKALGYKVTVCDCVEARQDGAPSFHYYLPIIHW